MTLKVVLKIDPEHGGEVIALLAKAFSRKELGIEDIRIERWATKLTDAEVTTARVGESVTALIRRADAKPKRKPHSFGLGARALKTGKPNGVVVILTGLSHGGSRDGLAEMWVARGLNLNGLGASLSKLAKRGYVTQLGDGEYRLTSKGAEFVNQWNEKHDHENREQS